MSWFREALSICIPEPGAYYTVIDPAEFYEWRFTKLAPQGALFTRHLPPSDIFTEGKVIASATVSDQHLKQLDEAWRLQASTPVEVVLKVGAIPSPQELLDKQSDRIRTFSTGVDRFKEDALTRIFIISQSKIPHLYRISEYTSVNVSMENFGPIEELIEKVAEVAGVLQKEMEKKTGRAFELEEWRRFQNVMDFVNNAHLHVDASKMERLLSSAKLKPTSTKKLSWLDCYLQISQSAQLADKQIKEFDAKQWVKASKNQGGK